MFLLFLSLFPGIIFAAPPRVLLEHEEYPRSIISSKGLNRFNGRQEALKGRLPSDIVPTHYDLTIIPIIDELDEEYLKAPGRVTITARCVQSTDSITLNAVEIKIQTETISVRHVRTGALIPVLSMTENLLHETITIRLQNNLRTGEQYSIEIYFESRVADDRMNGLYLSKFQDPSTGEINYHVGTQFEAIDARKAFPCFDEPALKAYFTIQIGRHGDLRSLSNMEQDGLPHLIDDRPGYFYDTYLETPVQMSTYLVAIVVMKDFPNVIADASIYPPARVSIWGPAAAMAESNTRLSAETAAGMLGFFSDYMDHPYDFTKLDSVAIGEFAYGAMENWGLNIYRPEDLLFVESEMTTLQKWRIIYVIAHEVSHQWFGNVVTMKWWSDLWLNEGLANYFQFAGVEAIHPEFAPWQRFTVDASQKALDFDGRPDAVPVHIDNETHFVQAPFEGTYLKGSALVKMVEGFLTSTTLQNGLRRYLKANIYGSVHQDDLFESLAQQAEIDGIELPVGLGVKEIMDSWTLQSGYPLIRVSRVSKDRIFITQERFSNDAENVLEPYLWDVPIAHTTKSESSEYFSKINYKHLPKTWIRKTENVMSHKVETTDEWLLVNPDAFNFHRVLYDDHLTQLLLKQLSEDHSKISALSRGQLIDDYFKSSFGEYISIKIALQFTEFLNKEFELPIWIPVFNNIAKIDDLLSEDNEVGSQFREYFLSKLTPAYLSVGDIPHPEDSPVTNMLRANLLDWACALNHPQCFVSAKHQVDEWMNSEDGVNPISPDLQPMIYCAAVSHGNRHYREFFLRQYENPGTSTNQRRLYLRSIACPTERSLLTEALHMAIKEPSAILLSDAPKLMGLVADNIQGRNVAFKFVQDNVDQILKSRVGENGIKEVISTLRKYFSSAEQRDQVGNFLQLNRDKFSSDLIGTIENSIAEMERNIKWMQVHRPGLTEFFGGIASD